MQIRHLAWHREGSGPDLLSERAHGPWGPPSQAATLAGDGACPPPRLPSKDQIPSSPAPDTYFGLQLLIVPGGKFYAAVDRDVHVSH